MLRECRAPRWLDVYVRGAHLSASILAIRKVAVCVISISRLNSQVVALHRQLDVMITGRCAVFIGGKTHVVLDTQFLDNAVVDLASGLFLSDFKEAPAGFSGDPFQNFLAIGMRLFGMPLASTATASTSAASRIDRKSVV